MKLRALLVIGITSLIVFFIYLSSIDDKVYFLTIGDYQVMDNNSYAKMTKQELLNRNKLEIYVDNFNAEDARVTDIVNNINNNQKVIIDNKDKTIKNALIKADFILLSIGSNDLFYKLDNKPSLNETLYDNIDEIINDEESMLKMIKEYCKEDIFVTGFYNPYGSDYDELIHYANDKLQNILNDLDMTYVDVNKCINNSNDRIDVHLNKFENECVADKIKTKMNKYLFENS